MSTNPIPSPLAALNNAIPSGTGSLGSVTQPCPLKIWKLNVKLEIAAGFQYDANLSMVGVALDSGGDHAEMDHGDFTGPGSQPIVQFQGDSPIAWRVVGMPSSAEWMAVQEEQVSLALGDDKNVTLKLRPKPWIRIKVVNQTDKSQVNGVAIDLTLPGNKQVSQTTTGGQPAAWTQLDLGPSAKLDKMADPIEVWEFIRVDAA